MIDEKTHDKIVAAAYGEADAKTEAEVRRLAESNSEADDLLKEYLETAASVKSISREKCPSRIFNQAKSITGAEQKKENALLDIYKLLFRRPAASFAAGAIFVMVLIFSILVDRNQRHYSHEEILAADTQAREALSIVGNVLFKTKKSLTDQILEKKVSGPIKTGIETVNNIFYKENKK